MPASTRALPRRAIRDVLLTILNAGGSTMGALQERHGRAYGEDALQAAHAGSAVWHARRDLMTSVAERMRIHPDFWGDNRKSSDFYNIIDQEIAKLRRAGLLIDWGRPRRLGVFRISRGLDHLISGMAPSIEGPIPTHEPGRTGPADVEGDMRRVFLSILTRGKKDNTYKFALARVLLDYCAENRHTAYGQTHEISYEYLSAKFLKYYWYQECKYHIKQDFRTKSVPKVVRAIRDVFGDQTPGDFEMLDRGDVERAEEKIRRTVFGHAKSKTSLVVPRFQKIPSGAGSEPVQIFYDYSDDEQKIYLKPEAFRFFSQNHGVLSRAVLAEWAKFLERINDSLPRLVAKIERDEVKKGPLGQFRNLYMQYTDHCFYCANRLESGLIHVDHFIPWSYMYDDNAWNLVLACRGCNLKKSDSLAQDEFYNGLVRRNRAYSGRIRALGRSLDLLDTGRGWEAGIKNHYGNCVDYGFDVISLP